MRIENRQKAQAFGTRFDIKMQGKIIELANKGKIQPTLKHLDDFKKIAADGNDLELTYVNCDIEEYDMNINDSCPVLFLKGPLVDELVKAAEGVETPIKGELFPIYVNSFSNFTLDNLTFYISEGVKSMQRQIRELKSNPVKDIVQPTKNDSEIDIAQELKNIFG